MKRKRRDGFSLMEVLLALSILLASLIVLGQMALVGRRHAEDAARLTAAQTICRTRLNEILIGAAPLAPADAAPVADMPGWVCSVELQPQEQAGLVTLRVTASQQTPQTASSFASEPAGKRFVLTRWMHTSRYASQDRLDSQWQEALSDDFLLDGALLP